MLKKLMAKMRNEEGQGLVEYALIVFLISLACLAMLTLTGTNVNLIFTRIAAALS